jgi:hypothetical protein
MRDGPPRLVGSLFRDTAPAVNYGGSRRPGTPVTVAGSTDGDDPRYPSEAAPRPAPVHAAPTRSASTRSSCLAPGTRRTGRGRAGRRGRLLPRRSRCLQTRSSPTWQHPPRPNEGDDAISRRITSAVERLEAASARATRPKGPDIWTSATRKATTPTSRPDTQFRMRVDTRLVGLIADRNSQEGRGSCEGSAGDTVSIFQSVPACAHAAEGTRHQGRRGPVRAELTWPPAPPSSCRGEGCLDWLCVAGHSSPVNTSRSSLEAWRSSREWLRSLLAALRA